MEAIKAYLERIKDIPILSKKEEIDLIKRARKGDTQARWKLINANLKLVVNIAKNYAHFDMPLMDLIAEGNIGLMRAIDKFNIRKGYRFATYAAWWIRQAVSRSIIEQGKTIRIPVYMSELISKYVKVRNKLIQKLKREPNRQEIAKRMRLPISKISEIELWMEKKTSLDAPIDAAGETHLSDFIKTTGYTDSEKEIERFFRHEQVLDLLEFLSEREKKVLDLRFGISDGRSHVLSEVAKELKISRERVRQIENIALKKLRRYTLQQQKENIEI
ncbi:MAG: sigma-70 family RNA polymerase sigma factor [Candidatus Omnitrophica bacterium]|nr:sigma-70 family RNA polymerase sigma factor [Candidatus Omnitrophota bacterium]